MLPLTCLALIFATIVAYMLGGRELFAHWPSLRGSLNPRALLTYGVGICALLATVQIGLAPLWIFILLIALLTVIARLDLETGMLSDGLTLLLGVLGLAANAYRFERLDDWWPTLALAAGLLALGWFFAGPYSRWRGRDMLGWGDVKFFAAAGLWLLPLQLPVFLIIAGGVGGIAALIYKLATGRAETPFAPALCLSLWLCVVFGLALETFV